VSEQENTDEKGPGVVGFSRAFVGRSFSDVHGEFWQLPIIFSSEIGFDRRFNLFARKHAVYDIGMIAGVNEMLLKAYFFGPAHDILNRPENIVQYTTLMLKLKALYEKYRTEKKINVRDFIADLDNIVIEFFDFSREVMEQSRCGQS